MVRGTEIIIKMRLRPNLQSVDIDYVLTSLLNLSNKGEKADLLPAARTIIELAAKRGDSGLQSRDWEETYKKLGISQSQYFYTLKILKNAGIIYKNRGRFYVSKVFYTHMANIAKTMNNFLIDMGVV